MDYILMKQNIFFQKYIGFFKNCVNGCKKLLSKCVDSRKKRVALYASGTLFVLIVAVTAAAAAVVGSVINKIEFVDNGEAAQAAAAVSVSDVQTQEEQDALNQLVTSESLLNDQDVLNILLFGVDPREMEDRNAKSNSMVILSIDKKGKRISTVSLLPEMLVTIPGKNNVGIMSDVHITGGPELVVQTIEGNFGISIDYFIRMDFYAFIEMVDKLGGVMIDVSQYEIDEINGYIKEHNNMLKTLSGHTIECEPLSEAGEQNLNGVQALAYTRVRNVGNANFDRTGRQRELLDMVFTNVKNSSPVQLMSFSDTLAPYTTTNLPKNGLLGMASLVLKSKNWPSSQHCLPIDGSFERTEIDGKKCVTFDIEANRSYLQKELYSK